MRDPEIIINEGSTVSMPKRPDEFGKKPTDACANCKGVGRADLVDPYTGQEGEVVCSACDGEGFDPPASVVEPGPILSSDPTVVKDAENPAPENPDASREDDAQTCAGIPEPNVTWCRGCEHAVPIVSGRYADHFLSVDCESVMLDTEQPPAGEGWHLCSYGNRPVVEPEQPTPLDHPIVNGCTHAGPCTDRCEPEQPTCMACEDKPSGENDPCAVCRRTTLPTCGIADCDGKHHPQDHNTVVDPLTADVLGSLDRLTDETPEQPTCAVDANSEWCDSHAQPVERCSTTNPWPKSLLVRTGPCMNAAHRDGCTQNAPSCWQHLAPTFRCAGWAGPCERVAVAGDILCPQCASEGRASTRDSTTNLATLEPISDMSELPHDRYIAYAYGIEYERARIKRKVEALPAPIIPGSGTLATWVRRSDVLAAIDGGDDA